MKISKRSPLCGGDRLFVINEEVENMIEWSRIVRCVTVGLVLAIVLIGLLPFILIDFASDLNGISDLDSSPLLSSISKFIHWK